MVAFFLSLCWHFFFGLLFTLKLGETETPPFKVISVSYWGKIGSPVDSIPYPAMSQGSVLPPFALPSLRFIEPPVTVKEFSGINQEFLAQTVKRIMEKRKEIPYPAYLDWEIEAVKKQEPSWKLPPSLFPKKKEGIIIHWEGEGREVGAKYLPPYPQWAQREGVESEVKLKFSVFSSGQVQKVEVEKSSGYVKLDLLAMEYMRKWEFSPSKEAGKSQIGFITFSFRP